MARPWRIVFKNALYHVKIKGFNDNEIFLYPEDKLHFITLIKRYSVRFGFKLHIYIILKSSVHLIIQTRDVSISRIMQGLITAYAMYYRRKYNYQGKVTHGRFKSVLIEREKYLLPLIRFLHILPVKEGLVNSIEQYRWSSYLTYIGIKDEKFIYTDDILNYFFGSFMRKKMKYKGYVENVLNGEDGEEIPQIKKQIFLGSNYFITQMNIILRDLKEGKIVLRRSNITTDDVLKSVGSYFKIDPEKIKNGGRKKIYRVPKKVSIYITRTYANANLEDISKTFKITDTAVIHCCKRLENEFNNGDKNVRRIVRRIVRNLDGHHHLRLMNLEEVENRVNFI